MADDMQSLQQQAARRVQRTQEYTRRVFEEHQGRTAALRAQPCPEPPQPAPVTPDTERWLLLGLAFLLWRNGCRIELILALLYLAY